MSWIKTIPYNQADSKLKRIYKRVKGPNDTIDNVLSIHSLRPDTLVGHMTLYKSVLHNTNNTLPKWYLESIGVYVSYLNDCSYCVDHHMEGLKKLIQDDVKSFKFLEAVKNDSLESYFDPKYFLGMKYAQVLTKALKSISKQTIDELLLMGFSEGEVLEINQVASYFNYVNRSVLGLGVTTKGDILGLSPNVSEDPTSWNHQ